VVVICFLDRGGEREKEFCVCYYRHGQISRPDDVSAGDDVRRSRRQGSLARDRDRRLRFAAVSVHNSGPFVGGESMDERVDHCSTACKAEHLLLPKS